MTSVLDIPTQEIPVIVPGEPSVNHDQLVAGLDRLASVLPPMPGIVVRLQQELSNEWVNIQRLSNLVRTDPTLAGSVLKVANSPYWRGSRQITEIEDAIQRMGMETLRSLTTVMALKGATYSEKGPAGSSMRDFWRHSLLVAVGSVQIARHSPIDRKGLEQVWMTGLLHDIGALLSHFLYPAEWPKVVQELTPPALPATADEPHPDESDPDASNPPLLEMAPERIDILDVERRVMGIDHAQIGATFVARHWHLPEPIPMVLQTWPDPTRLDPPLLAWTIHRADQAAQTCGICWQPERTRTRDIAPLPKESGAGAACDPEICLECIEKSIPLVEAILAEN